MYPDIFIAGAPKCGTTTLYDWLAQHPAVFAPDTKEPHHFFNPYGPKMERDRYLALYADARGRRAVDASVWTLFSETAVSDITKTVQSPKFIVCLRSPFTMAPSLHYQKLWTGHETVDDFEAAWHLDYLRRAGSFKGIIGLSGDADPSHMAYQYSCMLGAQVKRLLRHVDRKDVYFCFLEDVSSDAANTFRRLCDFINIDSEVAINFGAANPATGWRSNRLRRMLDILSALKGKMGIHRNTGLLRAFHKANKTNRKYPLPSPALMQEMRTVFREDIALLAQLTGRDLDHWLAF